MLNSRNDRTYLCNKLNNLWQIMDRCHFNVIYEKQFDLFSVVERYTKKSVELLHKDLHCKSIKSESERARTPTVFTYKHSTSLRPADIVCRSRTHRHSEHTSKTHTKASLFVKLISSSRKMTQSCSMQRIR